MIQAGCYNKLIIDRQTDQGFYLEDDEKMSVLLPKRYVLDGMAVGEEANVFVYYDSEDRLIATTETPGVVLHETAYLQVKTVTNHGAFLDWGLSKDLFVPFAEQSKDMIEGKSYLVYMYHDEKSGRLAASSKLHRFFDNEFLTVKNGDEVEIVVWHETDLGWKVIIDNTHIGLVYHNEVFKKIKEGDQLTAYIKNVREDNNIDVALQNISYKQLDKDAEDLYNYLASKDGHMPITDKSDPKLIYSEFGLSKKAFKRALGRLYKMKLVKLEKTGVTLLADESNK